MNAISLFRKVAKTCIASAGLLSQAVAAEESISASSLAKGESLFKTQCAVCHLGAVPEAPTVEAFKLYTPERIVEALKTGVMSTQGIPLSTSDKKDVALYLSGKAFSGDASGPDFSKFACTNSDAEVNAPSRVLWNGWGGELDNRRHQAAESKLTRDNIHKLELEWAFAFPQTTRVRSQPVVTPEMIFIGSQEGTVFAINTTSGCLHWTFQADGEVRGAIHVETDTSGNTKSLLFGDFVANAYSINAKTGALNWKTKVSSHPLASLTGSVSAADGLAYVPVSSSEVISAARPDYNCCSFRGSIVALDTETGAIRWTRYTTDKPVRREKNSVGVYQYGPSGAPVWSRPAVDTKRGLLYVTTGQNYSSPATGTSDAVIAMDLKTGDIRWVTQVTENDAWNGACVRKTPNCPKEDGPDFDIGSGAMLVTRKDGKDLVLIGQKSGMVYAMDPDHDGRIVWKQRVGRGGTMGGVHWGLSSDGETVFAGVSDLPTRNPYTVGDPFPGVHGLDIDTGEFKWRKVLPNVCPKDIKFTCFPGVSAAVASSPGLVYAGGLDGMLRIYDAGNGDILWEHNSHRQYDTVNGVPGMGGAIEADGPVVADGRLYVSSGYDKWGEIPGNVLLVFSLQDYDH